LTRGLIERFKKRGLYYDNVAEITKDIKHGDSFLMKVFREFGEDLGQFLRPFVYDFNADVLIVLGGIANALNYFRSELEAQLDIPVYPGNFQDAALLGVTKLFY
jgi:glucokinase